MKLKRIAYVTSACLFLSLVSSVALADDCSDLDRNQSWMSGYKKLEQAVKDNNDKQAIIYGEGLLEICPRLPKLNYMMAQMYQRQGDESKTLYYLQSATRYTKEFVVDTDILEKMWTDRIFAEHPESRPENVEKLKAELESLQSSTKYLQSSASSSDIAIEAAHKNYGIIMWTGVGVAAAGIAATAAGAALLVSTDSPISYNPDNRTMARVESSYAMSWTMIGVGVTAAVVGAFMTGFGGYHYVHSRDVSVAISPAGIGISGSF